MEERVGVTRGMDAHRGKWVGRRMADKSRVKGDAVSGVARTTV